MRITSKGQVTIPQEIREKAGLLPATEVKFEFVRGIVVLKKDPGGRSRGQNLIERMRGRGTGKLTTDQIMALTRG